MVRIALIRPRQNLPTQAGQFTPVWGKTNGSTQGWWLFLNAGQPYAAIHGNVGQSIATFAGSPAVGKWSTICMTTGSSGEGFAAVAGLNGSLSGLGASAGITYTTTAVPQAVGVNTSAPTISASQVEIYALLGSDTVRMTAAEYLAAHNRIVDAVQQGRELTGMFAGQDSLFDGRDIGLSSWVDRIVGVSSTLTLFGAPELCFSAARFA